MVVARRFGQGRVVAVMTDTIWRWRLAAKSWVAERSPYDTFWVQLMDWLIPKEQNKQEENRLELVSDRSNYLTGEKPELRAILSQSSGDAKRPATLALHVERVGGRSLTLALHCAGAEGNPRMCMHQVLVTTSLNTHRAVDIRADLRAAIERWTAPARVATLATC